MNGIGADLGRPDAPAKVAGEFTFLTDRHLDGCAWAAVVRSPYPHARVVSAGEPAVPGTIAVFGRPTCRVRRSTPRSSRLIRCSLGPRDEGC